MERPTFCTFHNNNEPFVNLSVVPVFCFGTHLHTKFSPTGETRRKVVTKEVKEVEAFYLKPQYFLGTAFVDKKSKEQEAFRDLLIDMHVLFALILLILSILCAAPLASADPDHHEHLPVNKFSKEGYEEIDIDLP